MQPQQLINYLPHSIASNDPVHYQKIRIWITRINAGARLNGMSYSQFMGLVNKSDMELNRKVLADLAMNHPVAFKAVLNKVK